MIDVSTIKFRCSAIGKIMTNDRSGKGMGDTARSYCKQRLREIMYSRSREYSNKYIEKGLACEEDAITLLSRLKKFVFKKNEERLENDYLNGTPDLYIGESITSATSGFDTKCSYDLWTFPDKADKLNSDYYWQDMGYMALTGAERWTTAYCLVNATPSIIDAEKKRLYFAMDCPNEEQPEYKAKQIEIEKNMIYDIDLFRRRHPSYDLVIDEWSYDIPMSARLVEFEVLHDTAVVASIYKRIDECREYIKSLL
jgi:hypothetical protein